MDRARQAVGVGKTADRSGAEAVHGVLADPEIAAAPVLLDVHEGAHVNNASRVRRDLRVGRELETKDVEHAMRGTGQQMVLLKASAEGDFEPSLVSAVRQRADALLVSANPFFTGRRAQLVALAARYAMPAGYPWREYADAGGLMSYGTDATDAYRQVGVYAGRILKGAKLADLPAWKPGAGSGDYSMSPPYAPAPENAPRL